MLRFVLAFTGAIVMLGARASAKTLYDGAFPIYPNVTPVGFSFSDPRIREGMSMGVDPLTMHSKDSPPKVDAWYRPKLSKCTRETGPGGKTILYTCKLGEVKIAPQAGGTYLLVAPDM